MTISEFWMLLAGLSLFLYGMNLLEDSLKHIEGRSFKLFLQKQTNHKFKAIISGILITALLQSSSIVNLMVLSLVGSGMISMRNSLAVVLGANIGGTFNSWLVAIIGFKIDLNLITLPFIGIAGIAMIVFNRRKNIYRFSRFCLGLGMLLLGLQFMKESMDNSIKHFNIIPFLQYPKIFFVLLGFLITSLIQTSAATVVLVLSALYAKFIPIETAIAMVLGAELGTTIKILLGSIGGIAAKKRIALGNFIFNFTTSALGFIFISPIIVFIQQILHIHDPIIILVSFQSFINITGVVLFYFFLGNYGNFLERQFKDSNQLSTKYLSSPNKETPSLSLEMMEREVELFINKVFELNIESFQISLTHIENYNRLKQAEGEILLFYSKLMQQKNIEKYIARINLLMEIIRNAMYSAKSIKDIFEDLRELSSSINEIKFSQYQQLTKDTAEFYTELKNITASTNKEDTIQKIAQLSSKLKNQFDKKMSDFYLHSNKNGLFEKDISTLFNVNREIYSSHKAIILAVADYNKPSKEQ
ncbi:MAG: Na/Pi cotransporter family protein [Sphingobacteriia bacterium]|nr:MAG: Na/Pi cotransporter family protein [Sphingobacteriia bacterium]